VGSIIGLVASQPFLPHYRELHAELLARPFPVVHGQVMVAHRTILVAPEEASAHRTAVAALAGAPGVTATPEEHGFQILRIGSVDLRIERHKEFTSFTALAPQSGAPFVESALDYLPPGYLDAIPGQILAAVEIASEQIPLEAAGTPKTMEKAMEYFGQERLVGGYVVEKVATVWSHFRLDHRGATRFLLQGHRLVSGRYGRLLQRLVEIESYRLAVMLALPLAELLGDLTTLSLATERLQVRCGSRFSLTEAYARILWARVRELREEQVPGYQTIGEFFDRRLSQALHTCQTAAANLGALSARLQSTTGLLRTRVEVNLQTQNQRLLASVDRRAAAQLRLQHAVEGLSFVVLTYYLANLLKMLLEGLSSAGLKFNTALVLAILLPFLIGLVWWLVRRAKRELELS